MARWARIVVWAVVLVPVAAIAIVALNAPSGGTKDYYFPKVRIDARVLPNGTLALHERRTFDFTGDFSFAFFTVNRRHAPPHRIERFIVRDGNARLPTSFDVENGDFKATWLFDAHDERRTFDISYRVRCAVDVYSDAAQLLWQFVGTGWTEPTSRVRVDVRLPEKAVSPPPPPDRCRPSFGEPRVGPTEPLTDGDVRAWGHGPFNGRVSIPDPRTVVLTVRDLRPGQFVEGSILFPPESVPLAAAKPEARRDVILAEEQRLAEEANALRRQHDLETLLVKILFGLVPLLAVGLVLLAYRRDRVPGVPRVLREPPEDVHPVELALLWSTYRTHLSPKTAYRTQFLHLARSGAIEIQPVGTPSDPDDFMLRLRREPPDGMDADFSRFLFGGDGDRSLSLREVKVKGRGRDRLQNWWNGVGSKTKSTVKKVSTGKSRAEGTVLALLGIGTAVYGYWRSVGFEEGTFGWSGLVGPLAIWLIPVGALSWFVAARLMPPRLPPRLRRRVERWKAFRRCLKSFSAFEDAPALAVTIWEEWLVYAVALGVADEVEKQVRAVVPAEVLSAPWPGAPDGVDAVTTYHAWHSSTPAYAPTDAATAVGWSSGWGGASGAGGGGGGFSGGGGGGGGGTGGGAG